MGFIFYLCGMNRREFCKIGALAMGALGIRVSDLQGAAVTSSDLRIVPTMAFRLTVIRRECYEDIQGLYLDDPESGPCEMLEPGDTWMFERGCGCPNDFCIRAWEVIVGCVNRSNGCVRTRENVLTVACPDGTRPVIFKVELL